MKRWRDKLKRTAAVALSVLLTANITDLPVLAEEGDMLTDDTPYSMGAVQTAEGVTTEKNIELTIAGLGAERIADPVRLESKDDVWTGSYVYFGTYEGTPVRYRVLDSNTTVFSADNTTQTMLLDCDNILWTEINSDNQSSAFNSADEDGNEWATSDIREYLNGTFWQIIFPHQREAQ